MIQSTKTSPTQFGSWVSQLPEHYIPYLIPVRKEDKRPDIPKGKSWKDKDFFLSTEDARERIERGKNVAFVPQGGMAVLDVDDPEKAQEYIDDSFLDTLVVETRSGCLHLYFENEGVENSDIEGVIEIRVDNRYLLVPGSYVPYDGNGGGDGLYKVINQEKPRPLNPVELPKELSPSEYEGDFDSIESQFDGEWLSRPCTEKIYDSKLPTGGRRSVAGKYLSMAYYLDRGYDKKGFMKFISDFADFQDVGHKHRPNEYNWMGTIKRKGLEWNCFELRKYFKEKSIPYPCGNCTIYNNHLKKKRGVGS